MNTPYEIRHPSRHDDYYLHDKDGMMQAVTASHIIAEGIVEAVNSYDVLIARVTELEKRLEQTRKDARFMRDVWAVIRQRGYGFIETFGDPDGIDFVANRIDGMEEQ